MLAAAIVLSLSSADAFAQAKSAKPAPGAMFQKMDLDGDGRISKEEAQKSDRKRLQENFDVIDANKDGFLDKEELKTYKDRMKSARKAE